MEITGMPSASPTQPVRSTCVSRTLDENAAHASMPANRTAYAEANPSRYCDATGMIAVFGMLKRTTITPLDASTSNR